MANLPLCPSLQYLRIISRGSQGWSEGHHNAVKYFLEHVNNMLSKCGDWEASDTTRLAQFRDNHAAAHFNDYRNALLGMHLKEADEVLLRNSGALTVFRQLIQKAEISGLTLFEVCRDLYQSSTLFKEFDLIRHVNDHERNILSSVLEKKWCDSNTIAITRMVAEMQRLLNVTRGVKPAHVDMLEMCAMADLTCPALAKKSRSTNPLSSFRNLTQMRAYS